MCRVKFFLYFFNTSNIAYCLTNFSILVPRVSVIGPAASGKSIIVSIL